MAPLESGRSEGFAGLPYDQQMPARTPEERVAAGKGTLLDTSIVAAKLGEDLLETRAALEQAEQALRRVQIHVGLLRQYDPELSMVVARARETANTALGMTGNERRDG